MEGKRGERVVRKRDGEQEDMYKGNGGKERRKSDDGNKG